MSMWDDLGLLRDLVGQGNGPVPHPGPAQDDQVRLANGPIGVAAAESCRSSPGRRGLSMGMTPMPIMVETMGMPLFWAKAVISSRAPESTTPPRSR